MGSSASARSSLDSTVDRILQRPGREQLAKLVAVAAATSGEVVAKAGFEPGDDICPTFQFPYPLPPRFDRFLEEAIAVSGAVRLFPYGIVAPDAVLVQVNMGAMER